MAHWAPKRSSSPSHTPSILPCAPHSAAGHGKELFSFLYSFAFLASAAEFLLQALERHVPGDWQHGSGHSSPFALGSQAGGCPRSSRQDWSWPGPCTRSRICPVPALHLSPVQCQCRRNGILTVFPTDTFHIRPPSSFTPPRSGARAGEEVLACLRTSVAFFSACSSFSWASLTDSEYFSTSSSVPFSFFCRPCCSSSSWGRDGGRGSGGMAVPTRVGGDGHPPPGDTQAGGQQELTDTLPLSTLGPHVLREPWVPRAGTASSIP